MMNRLWVRLLGAFVLVIAVGVIVTVTLTRQGAATQLSHLMAGGQMVQMESLHRALADYYDRKGSWDGLNAALDQVILAASDSRMMGGMMGMWDSRIRVIDENGFVVADTAGAIGERLAPGLVLSSESIEYENRSVGRLIVNGNIMTATGAQADTLLVGITRSVLIAALAAGAVAVTLGALFIRQITRPLSAMSQASQGIAAGDYSVRIPQYGQDELGSVADAFNRMAANLQLQETLRRNLISDVAHELRTPLSGIQGTVEALQDGIFPLTPASLAPIHEQVLLLTRLVDDLRILAHAEAGHLSLDSSQVDLVPLTAQHVASFLPTAQQRGISLRLIAEDQQLLVWADAQRLGQVQGNLIVNALRHTPTGGEVIIRLRRAHGGAEMLVLDTGEGIAADELPRVFDRFYRGDYSRSRQSGGSGLGLAISRQLVEAHGGRIWAESPPQGQGTGSGFYVWLPTRGTVTVVSS